MSTLNINKKQAFEYPVTITSEDEKQAPFVLKLYPVENKWCVKFTSFGTGKTISGNKGDMVLGHRRAFDLSRNYFGFNENYDDIFGEDRSIPFIFKFGTELK